MNDFTASPVRQPQERPHEEVESQSGPAAQEISTAQQWFNYYSNNPAATPDADTLAALADKHVVLIASLGAQAIKGMEEMFSRAR